MGFTKKKKVEGRKNNIRILHEKCDKNSVLLRLHLQKTSHACSHRIYKNKKILQAYVRNFYYAMKSIQRLVIDINVGIISKKEKISSEYLRPFNNLITYYAHLIA